jgi:hypothetical protein
MEGPEIWEQRYTPRQEFLPKAGAKEWYERRWRRWSWWREAPDEARVVRPLEAFEEGNRYYTVMTPLCVASLEAVVEGYSTQPYSLEDALLWGVELATEVHTALALPAVPRRHLGAERAAGARPSHLRGGPGAGRA